MRKVGQSDKHVSLSRDPEQHDSPAIRPLSLKYAKIETSKRPVPTTILKVSMRVSPTYNPPIFYKKWSLSKLIVSSFL